MNEEVSKQLETFLDLEEKEIKVYLALLSLGNIATLGQASMVAGFDILVTNAALDGLTQKGYLMHYKDYISRYYALEPFLDNYTKLFDPFSFAGLIRKLTKSLETAPLGIIDDAERFKQYLSKTLQEKKTEIMKGESIEPSTRDTIDKILGESVKIIANTAFSIIQDMEVKGKKIQERTAKKFQNETNSLFQAITQARESLLILFRLSREIKVPANFLHDVLVGENSILITLRDIISRSRKSLLIFMPIPEIKSLMNLIELSQRHDIKIDVIGKLNKTPTVIIEKIKNDGIGINLRQLDDIDFWGVIMDEKEFLFAPNPPNNEEITITGIFTTYIPIIESYLEHLKKFIMRAQPI